MLIKCNLHLVLQKNKFICHEIYMYFVHMRFNISIIPQATPAWMPVQKTIMRLVQKILVRFLIYH